MRRIMSLVLFGLIISALSVAAPRERLIDQLDLTKEQVLKIQDQRQLHLKEQTQLRDQIQLKEQELKVELDRAETDQNKVQQKVQELNQLRTRWYENKIKAVGDMKAVLNKDQLKKMEELSTGAGGFGKMQKQRKARAAQSAGDDTEVTRRGK